MLRDKDPSFPQILAWRETLILYRGQSSCSQYSGDEGGYLCLKERNQWWYLYEITALLSTWEKWLHLFQQLDRSKERSAATYFNTASAPTMSLLWSKYAFVSIFVDKETKCFKQQGLCFPQTKELDQSIRLILACIIKI